MPQSFPFDPRYVRLGFDKTRWYKTDDFEYEEIPCYYCGEPGVTDDHTFPRVAAETLADDPTLLQRRLMRIVPCCLECNVLLRTLVFTDLAQRKAWLKKRLRQRYKTLLAMPEWTDSEIARLHGRLRQYVLNSLAHRERLLHRLSW